MTAALLEISALEKRFGGVVATDRVSLEVAAGEIHALIGPNGAGKTTLVAQIAGSLAPDAGRIAFAGADITSLPQHARVMQGLARSYQITSIFKRFTVAHNLTLAVQARSGSSFSFWRPVAAERSLVEEARVIAMQVGLESRMDALAGSLSHAEQRGLEVGLALATNPKLLLLDEPMAGMGPDESQRMIALIAKLRERVSVLLVEHDMDAVFRLANRISVLLNGRVIATGTPDEIRTNAEVKRAYLGDELGSEVAA